MDPFANRGFGHQNYSGADEFAPADKVVDSVIQPN